MRCRLCLGASTWLPLSTLRELLCRIRCRQQPLRQLGSIWCSSRPLMLRLYPMSSWSIMSLKVAHLRCLLLHLEVARARCHEFSLDRLFSIISWATLEVHCDVRSYTTRMLMILLLTLKAHRRLSLFWLRTSERLLRMRRSSVYDPVSIAFQVVRRQRK